jgi:hypothetical protein
MTDASKLREALDELEQARERCADARANWETATSTNARLIAAAPDLLAAAKKALNFIENTENEFGATLQSGNVLRAAIAKAEGRS